jgi:hypothetical protein
MRPMNDRFSGRRSIAGSLFSLEQTSIYTVTPLAALSLAREFVTVLSYVQAGKTLNEVIRSFVVSATLAVIVAAYNSQWLLCVAWIGVCIVDYLFATDVSPKLARSCDLSACEEDEDLSYPERFAATGFSKKVVYFVHFLTIALIFSGLLMERSWLETIAIAGLTWVAMLIALPLFAVSFQVR